MHQPGLQSDADESRSEPTAWSPDATPVVEIAAIHNYDHWEGHSVEVAMVTPDGESVARERRYLSPGRSARLTAAIAPGDYQLRVRVDGVDRARREFRLDRTASATAAIELGNGAVSVTAAVAPRDQFHDVFSSTP